MNSDLNEELEQYACRFFKSRGAILEKNNRGLEVLLPENLSQSLSTPEHININTASGPSLEDAYSINYGSSLLEKMIDEACKDIPVLSCRFNLDYLKKEGFDNLVRDQFIFLRSVGKIENRAEISTAYVLLTCRYKAQSDEQKLGLLDLVFNLETGAYVPGMAELLLEAGGNFITLQKPAWKKEQLEMAVRCIKEQSAGILAEELKSFHETMTRRFKRDAANLEEYYQALEKEMKKTLQRHRLSEELIKERHEKISLLPRELERKRDDLFKKYSIRVDIEPCAAMLVNTPAVKVLCYVLIGKRRKNISLVYNPVTKALDPLVCQGCGKSITSICFCDHLHLLCPACGEKCPLCP